MSPRAYRMDWATGIASVEAITTEREQQAITLPVVAENVPERDTAVAISSVDIALNSESTTPVSVVLGQRKVGYVKASRGRGRGLPPRLPEPDPTKSTTGTGKQLMGNVSGTVNKYLPAEELGDSEIESTSDLSGDDDLFETMLHRLYYDFP